MKALFIITVIYCHQFASGVVPNKSGDILPAPSPDHERVMHGREGDGNVRVEPTEHPPSDNYTNSGLLIAQQERCRSTKALGDCFKYRVFKLVKDLFESAAFDRVSQILKTQAMRSQNSFILVRLPFSNPVHFGLGKRVHRAFGSSSSMELFRFVAEELDRFLSRHGLMITVRNIEDDEPLKSDSPWLIDFDQSKDERNGRKVKKKEYAIVFPMLVLFKFLKIKMLLVPILLGVVFLKKLLIITLTLLPYLVDQAIGLLIYRDLGYSFLDFIGKILKKCDWNPRAVEIPIHFNEPPYGDTNPRFIDFTSPGSLLAMIFILAVALTGGSMLTDKGEGTMERCLVAGVNMFEILLSHIITEFVIMLGQTVIILGLAFVVFDLQNVGPWSWVILMSVLQGMNGMSLGFLLSTVFDSQVMATLLGVGYFLGILFLSGILWPIEGMHWLLQYIVWSSPLSYATEAMRSIMLRGWGITEPVVYAGFISTILWIMIYLMLTLLSIKLKKAVH